MSAETINKPEGFIGDGRYTFVPLGDVLGGEVKDAPANISAFIRRVRGPGSVDGGITHVYRVVRGIGQKVRRESVGRAPSGLEVDEDYLGHNFGPGEYSTTTEWIEGNGRKGLQVDNIFIAEDWRDAYNAFQAQKRLAIKRDAPELAVGVASPANQDPIEYITKTAAAVIPLVEMFKSLMPKQESVSAVMAELQKAQVAMFRESLADMVKMRREMLAQVQATIIPPRLPNPDDDDDPEELPANTGSFMDSIPVPAWLRPFLPDIARGISMLLSGGVKANIAKTAILCDDDIKAIMADPVKWDETVKALSQIHGSEKVQAALATLKPDDASEKLTEGPKAPPDMAATSLRGKAKPNTKKR
jgi:hypothetical protein